jgi:signal transduction histidine kinase
MNSNKSLQNIRLGRAEDILLVATTLAAIAISILCLSFGYFIIFQNFFYIPIIIACIHYARRGFLFSVVIAIFYFCLITVFTREASILLEAFIRVLIFILIAGIITYLSSVRRRAEEALVFTNMVLHTQQESTLDGILVADGKGRILSFNQHFVDMWGIPPDVIESKSEERALRSVMDKLENPEEFVHKVKYLYEAQNEICRDEVVLKDGRIFDRYTVPMLGAEGKFYGRGWYFRDITGQKRMDAERRRVAVLKDLAEAKSRFASMVSHELRSPLAVLKEALNIMLEGFTGEINSEQKNILEIAKGNTDRLGRLINNVLDFQKMEAGKMEFDLRKHDINKVIREIHTTMSLLSKRGNLDLRIELEEGLPGIKIDRDKIIQVLMNLLGNAIKNTASGSVTLSAQKEKDVVHIQVRDTGKGIPAESLSRIFMPFERVDRSSGQEAGTGLGLAISKEIILAHHGQIWVESEVGKGSTFHFTLPL